MYSKTTDGDLLKILRQCSLLTFESQLSLREEIQKRELQVDLTTLNDAIANKLAEIKNLEYLKDIGFEAQRKSNGISVTRTTKAILVDIVSLIFGLVVFFIGVYGIVNLVMTFVNNEDLDVFTLAYKFAIAALIFIAIGFFNGLKRLFNYSGFQLSNDEGALILKKRFDVKLEEIKANAADLFVETNEEILSLKLGEETIFTANADNLIQAMTLKELANQLKA